jgi:hypothetical protein
VRMLIGRLLRRRGSRHFGVAGDGQGGDADDGQELGLVGGLVLVTTRVPLWIGDVAGDAGRACEVGVARPSHGRSGVDDGALSADRGCSLELLAAGAGGFGGDGLGALLGQTRPDRSTASPTSRTMVMAVVIAQIATEPRSSVAAVVAVHGHVVTVPGRCPAGTGRWR